ncbi:hypothetical protein N7G274_003342 [Stereocaulon virgatum]|uniref:CFEM domain-containing protein n=1 Tax=Stereocaulon virgatum TaxID=373712 RepID=A0ABR4ADC2_9LECA
MFYALNVLLLAAVASLTLAQDISVINGLPACGHQCFADIFRSASNLGCVPNDIACLCDKWNFGNGVRDCSSNYCPAGTDLRMINSVADSFCNEALAGSSSSAAGIDTTTSLPRAATTSSPASTPTVTKQRLSGLSSSTKTGIGVGVPLGVIILLLIGVLVFHYWRNRQDSSAKNHGDTPAAGTNTADDGGEAGVAARGKGVGVKDLEHDTQVGADTDLAREVHGEELPAYSKESPVSPGVFQQEVFARPRSA